LSAARSPYGPRPGNDHAVVSSIGLQFIADSIPLPANSNGIVLQRTAMDLVTLIAACAFSVGPNNAPTGLDRSVMQALVFEQSGGEPWSFSVPRESFARVLPTLKDAIREARAVRLNRGHIHVGLAGLATEPQGFTALMFAPCPNITFATREIAGLVEHCKAVSKPDPIYCAIAAYHGSWGRPDTWFADAVLATMKKGNAPNFDMPNDAYLGADDVAADAPPARQHAALTSPALTLDDRERGWSSALFPAKPMKTDNPSTDAQNRDHAAEQAHPVGAPLDAPTTHKTPDSLFVPRSSQPKP